MALSWNEIAEQVPEEVERLRAENKELHDYLASERELRRKAEHGLAVAERLVGYLEHDPNCPKHPDMLNGFTESECNCGLYEIVTAFTVAKK